MLFVDEECAGPTSQCAQAVIDTWGLFAAFYSDRSSHYWRATKWISSALTQFGGQCCDWESG